MLHNIEYKTITKHDFLSDIKELRLIIKGHGRTIAKLAKVDYSVYRNAMQGNVSNPVLLGSIFRAIKLKVNEFYAEYAA